MKKYLVAMALSTVLVSSAHANEELRGFRNYLFGMSTIEVNNLTPLVHNPIDPPYLFTSKNTIRIFGADYKYVFTFKNDALSQILIMNKNKFNEGACLLNSDLVRESLKMEFGELKQSGDTKLNGGGRWLAFTKSIADGGSVTMTTRIADDECSIAVGFGASETREYF